MKISLVYVHPTVNAAVYVPCARKFVQSYMDNPPGAVDHDIHVCINGGIPMGEWNQRLFLPLAPRFFQHNNYGKDIGAYQAAATFVECDLMVCLGAPIYFHRPGWLDRIVMAYLEYGPALYGAWGCQAPLPHLRTTGFWLPPQFLNSYPVRVGNDERYPFEHGQRSICLWTQKLGFEPIMVTWKGCYYMPDWHPIGREESLFIDQHVGGRA